MASFILIMQHEVPSIKSNEHVLVHTTYWRQMILLYLSDLKNECKNYQKHLCLLLPRINERIIRCTGGQSCNTKSIKQAWNPSIRNFWYEILIHKYIRSFEVHMDCRGCQRMQVTQAWIARKDRHVKIVDVVATRSLVWQNGSKLICDYEILSYIPTIKKSSELISMRTHTFSCAMSNRKSLLEF